MVSEVQDQWRPSGARTVQSWEERFVYEEGYQDSISRAAEEIERSLGRAASAYDRVVLHAMTARRHAQGARSLELSAEALADPLFGQLGNTGAAFALMQLVHELEGTEPNRSILVLNYGDGADALALTTTDALPAYQAGLQRGLRHHLALQAPVPSYSEYLKWRALVELDSGVRRPGGAGASAPALHREREEVLQFHGAKCLKCETVQYPPQRLCISCRSADQFEPVRLADQPARLFTYSMDYIAGTTDVPLVLSVVDFEAGGRAVLWMTDRDIERIAIDMPLEMTFRQIPSSGTIQSYYWKCTPPREAYANEAAPA